MDPAADSGFSLESLTPTLFIGSLILIVCVVAIRLSNRTGLPSLLIYLGVGLAIGETPSIPVEVHSAELTQALGYCALIVILAEGGLTTQWSSIRRSVVPAALLSTVGVLVSVVVVAVACHWLLGLGWSTALLVGAILSSTDAAAVFSVLRNVPLPRRLVGMLEAESGFNDAPVVILVVALAEKAADPAHGQGPLMLLLLAIVELAGGAVIGFVVGRLGSSVLRHTASASSGLFSIGILAVTVLAYAVAAQVHTSGFIATYLCALVLGNRKLPHRQAVHAFATAAGWLAQIGLFVLLGLLAEGGRLSAQIVPAIVVGLVLLLLARPLSVAASVSWFGMSMREQAFLSWAGLRGAVPVVLATVPVTMKAPHVEWIFDLVFVLVVIFTLVQAPTLPYVARWLGVTEGHRARELAVEATPLEEMKAQLLQIDVGPGSLLHGVAVFELRLPVGADVALIVRDGHGLVPTGRTTLRHGDQVLVVTTDPVRERAEKLIRRVSRHGRLAGWSTQPATIQKQPGRPGFGPKASTDEEDD
ncbi:MAG: potassium/proton antiporter [Dermatophilaceae bacterium]